MPYTATWTNANDQGRLNPGEHIVRLCDAAEIASAVNRRRLLTYQGQQNFSSAIYSGARVGADLLAGEVLDVDRVHYYRAHLQSAAHAIAEKLPLAGYFIWSLLDNFEWGPGYSTRCGLP